MNDYKNKQWLYKLGHGRAGIFAALLLVVPFTALTWWLYKNGNGAFVFAGFIDFFMIIAMFLATYRSFAFKALVGQDEIYYQTRPSNGKTIKFYAIESVWVSSGRGEIYCTIKTYDGEIIKIPIVGSNYEAIEYLKMQVEGRKPLKDRDKTELDTYEINGKLYGKGYIVGAIFIAIIAIIMEIFASKISLSLGYNYYMDGFGLLKYIGIFAAIAAVVLIIIRYKYLDIKIQREGFSYQTSPFKKKYYKYEDIKSFELVTKKVRTSSPGEGGSTFYRDYFVFKDKDGNVEKFQYEKHLYDYEIYILQKRINQAKGIKTSKYIADDFDLQEPEYEEKQSYEQNQKKTPKRHGILPIVFPIIVVILLTVFIVVAVKPMISSNSSQVEQEANVMEYMEVRGILDEKGFDTVDKETSYWFLEENNLSHVTSGVKDKMYFEFYQYNSDGPSDGVYNTITYNLNQDLEFKDREKYESQIKGGGKIFIMTVDKTYNIVAYKKNTVIYARCPKENKEELTEIAADLGYKK